MCLPCVEWGHGCTVYFNSQECVIRCDESFQIYGLIAWNNLILLVKLWLIHAAVERGWQTWWLVMHYHVVLNVVRVAQQTM